MEMPTDQSRYDDNRQLAESLYPTATPTQTAAPTQTPTLTRNPTTVPTAEESHVPSAFPTVMAWELRDSLYKNTYIDTAFYGAFGVFAFGIVWMVLYVILERRHTRQIKLKHHSSYFSRYKKPENTKIKSDDSDSSDNENEPEDI